MTFFLKYDVVSPKKIWGHLQTPLFTYKITYLAPLCSGVFEGFVLKIANFSEFF